MQSANPENRDPKDVGKMFARVAPNYDKINRAMCFGLDARWRKTLAKCAVHAAAGSPILDLACGSGDVALEILKKSPAQKIACADICPEMLGLARAKIEKNFPDAAARFEIADAENMPFESESFGACAISFGFRNFQNRQACLKEICRVLKSGAELLILEVARAPKCVEWAQNIFMEKFVPNIASALGGEKADYEYLAKTTRNFPRQKELHALIEACGFKIAKTKKFAFGCVALSRAIKI
ncbi:MAG: ubiquinone/menaquinone biosynthesis methyltransferase [Opitutales bacterium]|nr:ubiquinone/menaquinone biosynthesis methyltransferase [Opitutales bacterium]